MPPAATAAGSAEDNSPESKFGIDSETDSDDDDSGDDELPPLERVEKVKVEASKLPAEPKHANK